MSGSSRPSPAASSAERARLASPIHSSWAEPAAAASAESRVQEQSSELGGLDLDVLPRFGPLGVESQRTHGVRGIDGEPAEQVVHFLLGHSALESQGGDPLAVQPTGEVAQQRVPRFRGHAADDQLVARDADDQPLPAPQQRIEPMDEPGGAFLEMGMAGWVHRALVEHDGELDEEVREVASERGYASGRLGGGHRVGPCGLLRLRGVVHGHPAHVVPPVVQVYGLLRLPV